MVFSELEDASIEVEPAQFAIDKVVEVVLHSPKVAGESEQQVS